MLMAWDDSMIVWVLSQEYTNPTTNEVTIVPLCEDVETEELCESHFLNIYGGVIIENPYSF
jgi:GTP cyclohydrolase I